MSDSKCKHLELKIRELERALDISKKETIESNRNISKRDRKIRELNLAAEDFKYKFKDLENTVGFLELELRNYKRKFEEAQEITMLNQNRFRKVHEMYLSEVGRTEQHEEEIRRRRAQQNNTNYFVQA